MSLAEILSRYNAPKQIIDILTQSGIEKLYPPQYQALKHGVLNNKNLVIATPTASGKTLIAELCMLKNILDNKGLCLYIVPLKALGMEKFEDFKAKYANLGVKIGLTTGDYDHASKELVNYDIIVATSEKIDSLLRHRPAWLIERISVVIIDEIHLIGEPERGPTLEVLIARLKQLNPNLQFIALSATIKNAAEIAGWLDAELVESTWRPVPLKEGVFCQQAIYFQDNTVVKTAPEHTNDLVALCADTIKDQGQVLVFVNTRRSTQATAVEISKYVRTILSEEENKKLAELSIVIENTLGEATKICKKLAECVKRGVAFHHAGLHPKQRKLIEDNFRNNLIKVICSTPTLAAGVNLPSRRTIIRDHYRYNAEFGKKNIAVFEYKQMSGRAGRPQYDTYGESILMAKSEYEARCLFDEFILASPEPIQSHLDQEQVLSSHILSSIVGGYATNSAEILNFLNHTFFAYQQKHYSLNNLIDHCLGFLIQEKMVTNTAGHLSPTTFGARVSKLYLAPISGVILRDGLKQCDAKSVTPLAILYLICKTKDMPCLNITSKDYSMLEEFYRENIADFRAMFRDLYNENEESVLKTVSMFGLWIEEEKEEIICEKFNIGPGDVRRFIESADWLLYSAAEFAHIFNPALVKHIQKLRLRVHYGIKDELYSLVTLRGIGRIRSRSLFDKGFYTLEDIKKAPLKKLCLVPYIGKELALNIKQQATKTEHEETLLLEI